MKKFFLTAVIAISLIASSFAANNNNVNNKVLSGFRADFKGAEDVQWKAGNSYVTATFILDNKATEAFYDLNGNLIATTHSIAVENLPITAKRTLAKKYQDYTVNETISVEKDSETSYFVSLSNGKESIILQVINGQTSLYK